jgi:hypothetical protein
VLVGAVAFATAATATFPWWWAFATATWRWCWRIGVLEIENLLLLSGEIDLVERGNCPVDDVVVIASSGKVDQPSTADAITYTFSAVFGVAFPFFFVREDFSAVVSHVRAAPVGIGTVTERLPELTKLGESCFNPLFVHLAR